MRLVSIMGVGFTAIAAAAGAGGGGGGSTVYPEKSGVYSENFSAVVDNTSLAILPGWAAYNSGGATGGNANAYQTLGGKLRRAVADYSARPGQFVIGRSAPADRIFRAKIDTLGAGDSTCFVLAGTNEATSLYLRPTGSGDALTLYSKVAGTESVLWSQSVQVPAYLNRVLQNGDVIDMRLLAGRVHVLVGGIRITPVAGVDVSSLGFADRVGLGSVSPGSLTRIDDLYVAPLAADLSIASTQVFWAGRLADGGRYVPMSGTYRGTVLDLDYRVVNAASGAVVQTWARVTGATISGGNWAASVFVPFCDLTVNPRVHVEIRAANDVDSATQGTTFAVGLAVGHYGQSNAGYRGYEDATAATVANAYTWGDVAGSTWHNNSATAYRGAYMATMAATLATAIGIPVGVFVQGVGSQTIDNLIGPWWPSLVSNANLAGVNGYITAWDWTQGEAEAATITDVNVTDYRSKFDTLLGLLRGVSSTNDAKVGVTIIGRYRGAHTLGTDGGNRKWGQARSVLMSLSDKPGVYISSSLNDLGMRDDYHYTAAAFVEVGRRDAGSMAQALGYVGKSGRGPIITSGTRSGAVITMAVNLNDAASISGTGLTNYDVSTDDFATLLTVSSVAVSGSTIVITLSAAPSGPVKVRSFYGMEYVPDPVRAIGSYADGTTIPFEPIYNPITVS